MNFRCKSASISAGARRRTSSAGLCLLLLVVLAGCGSDIDEPVDDSTVQGHIGLQDSLDSLSLGSGLAPYRALQFRLSEEGPRYLAQTLVTADSSTADIGFNRLRIRSLDAPAANQSPFAFGADFEYGREIEVRDLTGDGRKEIVIHTSTGGNDPIASDGLCIVADVDGTLRETLCFESGAPEIVSLPSPDSTAVDSVAAILLHGSWWPFELSHAESVAYVDSLAFPGPVDTAQARQIAYDWYRRKSVEMREKYEVALQHLAANSEEVSVQFDVYAAAVQFLLYARRLSDSDLRPWFEIESANWEALLPEDYRAALKSLMFPANEAGEQM